MSEVQVLTVAARIVGRMLKNDPLIKFKCVKRVYIVETTQGVTITLQYAKDKDQLVIDYSHANNDTVVEAVMETLQTVISEVDCEGITINDEPQ